MDNRLWSWWAALEQASRSLGAVHVITDARNWPSTESRHLHPNPTGVIAVSGLVNITFAADFKLTLQPGDVALIGTGVWHEHERPDASGVWFGQGFMPTWSDITLPVRDGVKGVGRTALHPTRNLMRAAMTCPLEGRHAAVAAWLRQLTSERVEVLNPKDPALRSMVFAMWKRAHVRITPDELVSLSGAARAKAYRLFREWYGMTPKAFILASRLELAEALLLQGLPIAEVSWRCGWENPTTFARCWQRCHGQRPSDFSSQPAPRRKR